MIRDPEKMTSTEIEEMRFQLRSRIADAERRMLRSTEYGEAVRELCRLAGLKREIDEWE